MFNKKILAASMAVAMAGGIATNVNAIQVTPTNIGQVLLSPVYIADGTYTTEITVVNNRTDAAVKAKVVFRAADQSEEVKDFIIYLSPGDVWKGTVEQGTSGTQISSTDDSQVQLETGAWPYLDVVWGNQTAVAEAFADPAVGNNTFGHIEVFGLVAAAGTYTLETGESALVATGMSKTHLMQIVDARATASNTVPRETDFTICTPNQIATSGVANAVSSISPCAIQLSGEVKVIKTDSGVITSRASMPMTALSNAAVAAGATEADGFAAGYIVTNTDFEMELGSFTDIGKGFYSTVGTIVADDAIYEIESALAAQKTSWPYETSSVYATYPVISFVTKYRHLNDAVGICGGGPATLADQYSAPFWDTTIGEMEYLFTTFDNMETPMIVGHTFSPVPSGNIVTLDNEVNYRPIALTADVTNPSGTVEEYNAAEGWAYYSWQPRTGCTYTGAPQVSAIYKTMSAAMGTIYTANQNK